MQISVFEKRTHLKIRAKSSTVCVQSITCIFEQEQIITNNDRNTQSINTHLSLSRASQPFGEVPSSLVYFCFISTLKAKNLSYVSKTVSI